MPCGRRRFEAAPGGKLQTMNVLVLNTGSSSVKFQIISTDLDVIEKNADRRLARGSIERLGGEAVVHIETEKGAAPPSTAPLRDIRGAIDHVIRWACSKESGIDEVGSVGDIHAAGHRVVHGGEHFTHSVLINDEVLKNIQECIELAPLHNPGNLSGIAAATDLLGPALPQVAVFDTAFHQSLPERAYLYALPYQFYRRHRLRRYGFHGTSHRYVAYRYRSIRNLTPEETHVITIHLGNGCSAAAIREGRSIDTSMGLTPLEGLVMGTRCGDVDASVVDFLAAKEGSSAHEIESLLNKQSGLLGISGLTNDMRDLLAEAQEHNDRRALLAIDLFCYRVRKYIGAYLAAMGGADAVVFTGGIGENSPEVRQRICEGLGWLGLDLDPDLNTALARGTEGLITRDGSRLAAYVIPTDEELLIARDTVRIVGRETTKY
jgi:acetate kinase